MNKKILDSLSNITNDIPPIWLMRQAGRYLPEYRNVRSSLSDFLELCYTPKRAKEVTLQPIERFNFDAAIIFSDILVIPDAMNVDLQYVKGEGPKLEKTISENQISSLNTDNITNHLKPVYEALKITKQGLGNETALIGFVGAPWTIATYMIEGGGSKNFENIKRYMYDNKTLFDLLIEKLVDAISIHAINQIDAGAEVIQIFDSWSGVLSENSFHEYVIKPTKKIVDNIRKVYPEIKIIGFPKGAGISYLSYINEVDVNGVSIDYTVPVTWAAENIQPKICVQGNLDPYILASDKNLMLNEVDKIIETLSGGAFIFNLGHGILPHTPIENVEALVKRVRKL